MDLLDDYDFPANTTTETRYGILFWPGTELILVFRRLVWKKDLDGIVVGKGTVGCAFVVVIVGSREVHNGVFDRKVGTGLPLRLSDRKVFPK